MSALYPAIEPYNHFMLKVSEPHEIYVEESGNPDGLPVIFIHGGPGSGCSKSDRCFFDPEVYRIVLFDQRGAGRSTPHACLEDNNTQALISDIEAIREKLNIEKWIVFGGSWGSTLSLAYAQTHPDRTLGLILRGIFFGTDEEIKWFYGPEGAATIYPDYFVDFMTPIKDMDLHNNDTVTPYYKKLTDQDEKIQLATAKAWSIWEGRTSTVVPNHKKISTFSDPHFALSIARIECHFFTNHSFLKPNQLLNNMDKIEHLPGVIVQGRYDMICRMRSAWKLHQAWPKAEFKIIEDAGHSSGEPGVASALVEATQTLAKQFT